jgi:hypothetical protein
MVIFEQVLRDLIVAASLFENRVFLLRAPQVPAEQQKVPYAVFFPTGPLPLQSHQGPLGLLERDYKVAIFDPSQTKALALGDSLRMFLDGLRGDYEGVRFGAIFFRTLTWEYEIATTLFHITCEFRILFRLVNPQPKPAVPTSSINRSNRRVSI